MPKLPADLPENWTQGQTISPNGTETGLTEQHGYNYLMKQVNNTQTEVNNINGALPDVAQQATVEKINNKIGTESDADTQPTLFGRLAQLKNVLLEKLAEVLTKVTGIDGKIGTSGDTAGTETLFGRVKDISENMPTGAVKSVQRGVANVNSLTECVIPISNIDPKKSFVILSGTVYGQVGNNPVTGNAYVVSLSENQLVIKSGLLDSYVDDNKISWQVIECF